MSLVPSVEMEKNITLPNGNSISVDDTRYFPILFGGDQMTVARVHGVQLLRVTEAKHVTEAKRADRYEGIVPIIEDWHTRMTIMKVKHFTFWINTV